MKNAAKCDTWCELQNPANHQIFERKLRPRLSGRGHTCLGVTPQRGREGHLSIATAAIIPAGPCCHSPLPLSAVCRHQLSPSSSLPPSAHRSVIVCLHHSTPLPLTLPSPLLPPALPPSPPVPPFPPLPSPVGESRLSL
ncbi:unnamed protein product [Spirodela intermedia]|uniref:Uncharacterized protein n=1 Tax=Spirodela intermedia TaxID=51605 RepID=A0ABN7E8V1_SPIIN|nr:unnamed protein product [Spirodela intermedia]